MPGTLQFHDVGGRVALLGCRPGAWTENLVGGGLGEGRVDVDLAVLGANRMDYDAVNGMASHINNLGAWMGTQGIRQEIEIDTGPDGKVTSTRQHFWVRHSEPIRVSRGLNARAVSRPSIKNDPTSDVTTLSDSGWLITDVRRRRPFEEHLNLHLGIRDLISLSQWRLAPFQAREIRHGRDGLLMADGTVVNEWLATEGRVINTERRRTQGTGRRAHLFRFEDIGMTGIERWLALRATFARGVDPIVSLLFADKTSALAEMAQLGIGLEALGYQLARENGMTRRQAGDESFGDRINRLLSETSSTPRDLDRSAWPTKIARVYNGVKHANRRAPDLLEVANVIREGCLVFRIWVADRIGVDPKTIAQRLDRDPLNHPWT